MFSAPSTCTDSREGYATSSLPLRQPGGARRPRTQGTSTSRSAAACEPAPESHLRCPLRPSPGAAAVDLRLAVGGRDGIGLVLDGVAGRECLGPSRADAVPPTSSSPARLLPRIFPSTSSTQISSTSVCSARIAMYAFRPFSSPWLTGIFKLSAKTSAMVWSRASLYFVIISLTTWKVV